MRPRRTRITARAADRVSPRVEAQLLRLRATVGDGPRIGLPSARRVLILAPHPDDETLACGGAAALHARAGADVRLVVVTDGDAARVDLPRDALARRRREEVSAAAADLGLPPPLFLGLPDGDLGGVVDDLGRELGAHLAEFEPDQVLLPWFGDEHADHRAVNHALALASPATAPLIMGGETWTPVPANRIVDVTDVIEDIQAAAARHRTAARSFDLDAMLALKRYRTVHGLRGRGWAEGYLALPWEEFTNRVRADQGASRA